MSEGNDLMQNTCSFLFSGSTEFTDHQSTQQDISGDRAFILSLLTALISVFGFWTRYVWRLVKQDELRILT